jgi:DNA-binding FadR family transcriptional regulator
VGPEVGPRSRRGRQIDCDKALPSSPAAPGQSLTFTLLEALGRAVVSGRFDAGCFPTEAELTRRFGASRSIVREVVKMLTAKGLLSARPRLGTVVGPMSSWHLLDPDVLRWLLDRQASPELLRDFVEMRLAFEPEAAALAATRTTPAARDAIERAVGRLAAAARGADDPEAAEIAFHVGVLNAAANPLFGQLKTLVVTATKLSAQLTRHLRRSEESLLDRQLAARAVLSGAPASAHDRMRTLLLDQADLIERLAAGAGR